MSMWGRHAPSPEREIAIAEIEVGDRLRDLGEGAVADLMVSIAETGLIQPIVLRPFRPRLPIETVMIHPAGRPPGRITERLMEHLRAQRDALSDAP